MAKVTKTATVIAIMTKHADRPMGEVCRIIETQLPCKEGYGKVWYSWAVKKKVAPGKLEGKTKEVPAKKLLKEVGIGIEKPIEAKAKKNRFTGNVKSAAPKTEDEVSRIKAANLARMKAITARDRAIEKKIDKDSDTPVVDLDDDSFVPPRFLTKDQVKALV